MHVQESGHLERAWQREKDEGQELALYVIALEKSWLYELVCGYDSSMKGQELSAKAKNPSSPRFLLLFREN